MFKSFNNLMSKLIDSISKYDQDFKNITSSDAKSLNQNITSPDTKLLDLDAKLNIQMQNNKILYENNYYNKAEFGEVIHKKHPDIFKQLIESDFTFGVKLIDDFPEYLDYNVLLFFTKKETTKSEAKKVLDKYPFLITQMPYSHELSIYALLINPDVIEVIKQTTLACITAVKLDGLTLRFIKIQNDHLCELAVKQNNKAFIYVHNQTDKIIQLALKGSFDIKKYIKEWTDSTILNFYKNNNKCVNQFDQKAQILICEYDGLALQYITNPEKIVIKAALKQNGLALAFVSNKVDYIKIAFQQNKESIKYILFPSKEMQLEAVKSNGLLLQYCTLTEDIIEEAVKQNGLAIRFVLEHIAKKYLGNSLEINLERLIMMAVRQNGLAIQYLEKKTLELCMIAVRQNGFSLQFCPEYKDFDLHYAAVINEPLALEYVSNPSYDLCLLAVKKNGLALALVPEIYHDNELLYTALNQNGLAIQYVKNKSLDLCKIALNQNGLALQYIEDQLSNTAEIAVKQNPDAIQYVKNKTIELWKIAMERKPNLLANANIKFNRLLK